MHNDKAENLLSRSDMICSLAWLGMDVTWTFRSSVAGGVFGLVTIAAAIFSFALIRKAADCFLYLSCVLWVLMDETWLLSEFRPEILNYHIPTIMGAGAVVTLLISLCLYIKDQIAKKTSSDYTGVINCLTWLLMDVSWMLDFQTATLVFGLATFLSGCIAIARSENVSEGLINASMLCWIILNLSELATGTGTLEAVTVYSNPLSILFIIAFLVAGMTTAKFDPNIAAIFRKARLSAHKRVVDTTSVMPPSALAITITRNGLCSDIRVEGRIDSLTVERFQKAVLDESINGSRTIRVDASAVSYISSMGLRALLICHKQLSSLGGSFKINKISSQALQIIFMAGMDLLIEKH
jgi:anti-anti-sigma factor